MVIKDNTQLAMDFAIERHHLDTTGHDDFHIQRVVSIAKKISSNYIKIDTELLELIAWLHDIDDRKLSVSADHITVPEFLDQLDIDNAKKRLVISEIKSLSYTATLQGFKMSSLEGKIVQDADRLDAIGAIGIARVFAYGGAKGRPIDDLGQTGHSSVDHFYDKLLKLEGLMNTPEGKSMAHERTSYMQDFLSRLKAEQNF